MRRRYEVGLEKLASTEAQVQGMQSELEALQPKLIASTKETEQLMVVIEAQTVEADKVKAVVKASDAWRTAPCCTAACGQGYLWATGSSLAQADPGN